MNIGYSLLLLWVGLAVVVLTLALYRKLIARAEDMSLHVAVPESNLSSQQATVAQRLARIDFWGQLLTIFVVLYGLVLAGFELYAIWTNPSLVGG
jgi:hypothetical protein